MSTPVEDAKELREQGKLNEAIDLLDQFLQNASLENQHEQIDALNEQIQCLQRLSRFEKADSLAKEALRLAEGFPHYLKGQGDALNNLGIINWKTGKFKEAQTFFHRSLTLREQIGDKQNIGASLNNLGLIHWQQGNLDQAEEFHLRSYEIEQKIGDSHSIAVSLNNLGNIYWQRGHLDQTIKYYQQSLTLKEKGGNPESIAVTLSNLGEVFLLRGELEQAEDYYKRSLVLREQVGNLQDISVSLRHLGCIYQQQGKIKQAKEFLQRALTLQEKVGNPQLISETILHLVKILLMLESVEDAKRHVSILSELVLESQLADVNVRFNLVIGLLRLKQGNLREALTFSKKAKKQAEQIPFFELVMFSTILQIEILLRLFLLIEDDELIVNCETLLQGIEDLSKRENLHGTYIESIFIQGLLKRTKFNLNGAIELFQRVELLAEERGFHLLAQKAQQELSRVQTQISKLNLLQRETAQSFEQNKLEEVLDYIQKVQKFT